MQLGYQGHGLQQIVDPWVSLPRHEMLILSLFLLNTAHTFHGLRKENTRRDA